MLLTKGYTLVRRHRLLMVINEEDGVPPQFVELVSLADLEQRGEFELVKCLFHLAKMEVTEAEQEITKLVGPTGSVVALPRSQQLLVTEMAGRMRTIQEVIERIENPESGMGEGVVQIQLQNVDTESFLTVARTLLGLPEGQNSNENIRIAVDPISSRLFASGNRAELQKLRDLVPLIDRPSSDSSLPLAAIEEPQLATYPINKADPASVLAVMQTLLAGLPDVRLALEPTSNKLIALARPSEHRTIVETLRQLEGDVEQVEVIQLRKMDPQMVILTISKLFAETAGGGLGPKVDGDPTSRKLWVRGTTSQVAQVRELVEKLEGTDASAGSSLGDNIRVIPFSGSGAETALDNAQTLWPALRTNRIRTVTPSAISPTLRERRTSTSDEPAADDDLRFQRPAGPAASRPRVLPTDRPAGPSAQVTGVMPVFVSWTEESPPAQAPEVTPSEPVGSAPTPQPTPAARRRLPRPNRHLRRRRHPPRRQFPPPSRQKPGQRRNRRLRRPPRLSRPSRSPRPRPTRPPAMCRAPPSKFPSRRPISSFPERPVDW